MMAEERMEIEAAYTWPKTGDVPYEILARKVAEFCRELNRREAEMREHQLEAARRVWPDLKAALKEKGKVISLNGFAEPVFPEWAEQPVVPIGATLHRKPKTKAEAWEAARRHGDGGWATLGELWMWVVDAGPVMERAMREFGYLMPKK